MCLYIKITKGTKNENKNYGEEMKSIYTKFIEKETIYTEFKNF